jgi:hypothetical protein
MRVKKIFGEFEFRIGLVLSLFLVFLTSFVFASGEIEIGNTGFISGPRGSFYIGEDRNCIAFISEADSPDYWGYKISCIYDPVTGNVNLFSSSYSTPDGDGACSYICYDEPSCIPKTTANCSDFYAEGKCGEMDDGCGGVVNCNSNLPTNTFCDGVYLQCISNELWGGWSTSAEWVDVMRGDFNGDGLDDVIGRVNHSGDLWVAVSRYNGFKNEHWGRDLNWKNVTIGDFNGDGKDDVVSYNPDNGEVRVSLSSGSGFTSTLWITLDSGVDWSHMMVGDFNGDDKDDLVVRNPANGDWRVLRSSGSGFVSEKWTRWSTNSDWKYFMVGDFNGDGKSDIVGRISANGDWWVAKSSGSGFVNEKWTRWSISVNWLDVMIGDFNGDGKDDIIGRVDSNGDWWVGLSNGAGFDNIKWTRWNENINWLNVMTGDFNGDGLDDIAGRVDSNGDWWVGLSEGSKFKNLKWARWDVRSDWVDVLMGDFSGRGSSEVVGRISHSGHWWFLSWDSDEKSFRFGNIDDTPIIGDWNGDGIDNIGVWRSGSFYLDYDGNGEWNSDIDKSFRFGNIDDTPIIGDWNGDGIDNIGVWRSGSFYLDYDGNGVWDGSVIDKLFTFGSSTDTPIIGDWNGDGIDNIGVWRSGSFYLDYNGNGAWDSGVDLVSTFRNPTDTPIIGDFNGDGIDNIGAWSSGSFYFDYNGNRVWDDSVVDKVLYFQISGGVPIIGNWNGKNYDKMGYWKEGSFYYEGLVKSGNCDGNWISNGCEVNLVDYSGETNCGVCGNNCSLEYGAGYECVNGVCTKPFVGFGFWTDMNGDRISLVRNNSYVRINSSGSFPYNVFESVGNNLFSLEDNIWNVNYVSSNGLNFSFDDSNGLLSYSENLLVVNLQEKDKRMEISILDPLCGNYSAKGSIREIIINASDPDDLITGNVSVSGVKVGDFDNSNGNIVRFSYNFNSAGNIQIVVTANNSKGYRQRVVSNIMVYDTSGSSGQEYVAACIDSPRNFDVFETSVVFFNASSSGGLKFSPPNDFEPVGPEKLFFNWTFFNSATDPYTYFEPCLGLGSESCPDDEEGSVYLFSRHFPTVNNNRASLTVSLI